MFLVSMMNQKWSHASSQLSSCELFCSETSACANDPHHHGSYCKNGNIDPPVCFGFFWRDFEQTQKCYYPNDPTCPQAFPVVCPNLPTATPVPLDTCDINCLVTPACAFSPTHPGSYCKTYLDIPVCFGLYWRTAEQTEACFFPTDPTCPQNLPVLCG